MWGNVPEVRLGNNIELGKRPGLMILVIYSSEPQVDDCKFLVNKTSSVYAVLQRRYFIKLITVKWNWLKKGKENGNTNIPVLTMQKLHLRLKTAIWGEGHFWFTDEINVPARGEKPTYTTWEKVCVQMRSSLHKLESIWSRKYMWEWDTYPKIQSRKG